jgi:hypothetical protein
MLSNWDALGGEDLGYKWTSQWRIYFAGIDGEARKTYNIRNRETGYYLEMGPGGVLRTADGNNNATADNRLWTFSPRSGPPPYIESAVRYFITNVAIKKNLNAINLGLCPRTTSVQLVPGFPATSVDLSNYNTDLLFEVCLRFPDKMKDKDGEFDRRMKLLYNTPVWPSQAYRLNFFRENLDDDHKNPTTIKTPVTDVTSMYDKGGIRSDLADDLYDPNTLVATIKEKETDWVFEKTRDGYVIIHTFGSDQVLTLMPELMIPRIKNHVALMPNDYTDMQKWEVETKITYNVLTYAGIKGTIRLVNKSDRSVLGYSPADDKFYTEPLNLSGKTRFFIGLVDDGSFVKIPGATKRIFTRHYIEAMGLTPDRMVTETVNGVAKIPVGKCAVMFTNQTDNTGLTYSGNYGICGCAYQTDDGKILLKTNLVYSEGFVSFDGVEKNGFKYEAGVFAYDVEIKDDNGGTHAFKFRGPQLQACVGVSKENTCFSAGAKLVDVSYSVKDKNGNGIGCSVGVGVDAGAKMNYYNGVVSGEFEVGLGLSASIQWSVNVNDALKEAQKAMTVCEGGYIYVKDKIVAASPTISKYFTTQLPADALKGYNYILTNVNGTAVSTWDKIEDGYKKSIVPGFEWLGKALGF